MKRHFIIMLICLSCKQTDNVKEKFFDSDNEFKRETVQNNYLKIDSLKQFTIYEKLKLNEISKSPDSIISDYVAFIENYPNSFWKQEVFNRISTIDSIRKFWSEKDGWKLLNSKPLRDMEKISCPSSFNF